MDQYSWGYDDQSVDWTELSELYRIAPLGNKSPPHLRSVFANSMFKVFVYADEVLVGAGRALATVWTVPTWQTLLSTPRSRDWA